MSGRVRERTPVATRRSASTMSISTDPVEQARVGRDPVSLGDRPGCRPGRAAAAGIVAGRTVAGHHRALWEVGRQRLDGPFGLPFLTKANQAFSAMTATIAAATAGDPDAQASSAAAVSSMARGCVSCRTTSRHHARFAVRWSSLAP